MRSHSGSSSRIAIGGDASAGAANLASSDNDLTLSSTLETGDAIAGNSVSVVGGQTNDNSGSVLIARFGSGVSAINQSNDASVLADDNSAYANSGGNVQATGGQLNLTGQLALAGAQGSPGLALALGVGIAAGGDALASAGNVSGHSESDAFNNVQDVTNDGTTGGHGRGELGSGRHAGQRRSETDASPFVQSNSNSGNAYTLVGDACLSFAGAFVTQFNDLVVGPSDNEATANSGYNLQASGPQLNGNLQLAGAGASGGWAGSVGLLGLAVAFGGDADATAANVADSGNSQTVSNSLVTGDATAQNFTGVVATQTNTNEGNAGALDGLRVHRHQPSAASFSTTAPTSWRTTTTQKRSTGYNAQIGGFQGNGTIQGAGAIASGGWAGALGALALANAGDATATAANLAGERERQHGDQRPRDR